MFEDLIKTKKKNSDEDIIDIFKAVWDHMTIEELQSVNNLSGIAKATQNTKDMDNLRIYIEAMYDKYKDKL